jgi:GAF domain-containing protein
VTPLTYFDVAVAAGVQASGLSFDQWTSRDRDIAKIAAEEALKAWARLQLRNNDRGLWQRPPKGVR